MFLLLVPLFASIVTGNATAQTTVTNDVSGNSNVETHITTSVNGKVTTVESDKPGTIEVKATENSTEVKKSDAVLATTSAQPKNPQTDLTLSIISFINTLLTKLFQKLRIGS